MPASELAKNANAPFSFAERAMYQPRQRFDRDVYQCHFKRMANKIVPEDAAETEVNKSTEHTADNNNSAQLLNDNYDYVSIEEVVQENVTAASSKNIHNNNALLESNEMEENNPLSVEAAQDLTQIPPQHSIKTVIPHNEHQNIIYKTTSTSIHTHHGTLPTDAAAFMNDIINSKNEESDENKYVVENSKKNKKKDVNHQRHHQHHHYNVNVSANQNTDKSDCNRVIVTRAPAKSKIIHYRKM